MSFRPLREKKEKTREQVIRQGEKEDD